MHSVTDRRTDGQTDDRMMPIADNSLLCSSTIGKNMSIEQAHRRQWVRQNYCRSDSVENSPLWTINIFQSRIEHFNRPNKIMIGSSRNLHVSIQGCNDHLKKVVDRQLRSADSSTCVVLRWNYSNFGYKCFTAVRPSLWNSLPAGLRQTAMNSLHVGLSGC